MYYWEDDQRCHEMTVAKADRLASYEEDEPVNSEGG